MPRFLYIIILSLHLTTNTTCSQVELVNPKADSLSIAWEQVTLDASGKPEHVSHYKIYYALYPDTNFILLTNTPPDTTYNPSANTTISLKNFILNTRYTIGVTAVDWVGNESAIHASTDITALPGRWVIVIDNSNPESPNGLKPEENYNDK